MLERAGASPLPASTPGGATDNATDRAATRRSTRDPDIAGLLDAVVAQQVDVCRAQAQLLRSLHALASCGVFRARRSKRGRLIAHGFCGVEVAAALTWSQYTAEQSLAMAELAVSVCPEALNDVETGRLDWGKLRMLQHELADVEPVLIPAIVDLLRPEFDRCTVGQLRERLRRLVLQIEPASAQRRHDAAVTRRRVRSSAFANGTAAISAAYLPVDRAAAAWNNIDRVARRMHAAGDPEQRSMEQLRADVYADLLAGRDPQPDDATSVPPERSVVTLRIDLTTLACLNDDPGLVPGFGPVLADIARQTVQQVAASAQWRFEVTEDAATLAEGSLRYRPTPVQRAFIAARDRTCRAPGCMRPAKLCDIDHIVDWAKGGPTTVDNLCSLCELHHQAKHEGGFTPRRTKRGIVWTTPFGRRYLVLPHDAPAPSDRAGDASVQGGRASGRGRSVQLRR